MTTQMTKSRVRQRMKPLPTVLAALTLLLTAATAHAAGEVCRIGSRQCGVDEVCVPDVGDSQFGRCVEQYNPLRGPREPTCGADQWYDTFQDRCVDIDASVAPAPAAPRRIVVRTPAQFAAQRQAALRHVQALLRYYGYRK